MSLKYEYKDEETPEERLRNKLQPLFFLVEKIDSDGHCNDMPEVIEVCKENLNEIRDHLSDIKPFYTLEGDKKDNRLENLEIWVTKQPKGQRVSGLLEYAKWILKTYKTNK